MNETNDRQATSGRLQRASDAILGGRAADGDTRAFAVLVSRYGRLLRWYAARIVGMADSDDVVQDALLTAWQQLPTLTEPAAIRGWLIRLTTRKALDHARTQKHHDDIDALDRPAPASEGPAGTADAAALSASLTQALNTLPPNQRQAWLLREVGEYRYDDIASELELPVSTVRGLLSRARRSLIAQMEGWR